MPSSLPPVVRAPVPGWMWWLFGLGLIPVGVLMGVTSVASQGDQMGPVGAFGGICGFVLGVPMIGGLALAARLFNETALRLIGGVVFAFFLMIVLAGVIFAGCMCMMR